MMSILGKQQMPSFVLLFLSACLIGLNACQGTRGDSESLTETGLKSDSSAGYTYQYLPDDPLKTRIYTLENGLKVYLSRIPIEPQLATAIAVRTGSKNDPADNTGLSHYLEHIMFKGTSKLGAQAWQKEGPLLDTIEALFETYKATSDSAERRRIYSVIDSLSYLASTYSVANEYDLSLEMMGAEGTNAFTSNDMTVYINEVPSNELERWLALEAERFSEITPRLFHTELEAVYEEKNIALDSDYRRARRALFQMLFPGHTYGTQTTLGKAEHLKSPSIKAIKKHFADYYVPNNMAIVLAGDLEYDASIKLIDATFGKMQAADSVPTYQEPELPPLEQAQDTTVKGPENPNVRIAYRLPIESYEDRLKLDMMASFLGNEVGLLQSNLIQKQKVLKASARSWALDNYGLLFIKGEPREGQSLQEVEKLLLAQVDSLKSGKYPDWLKEAYINQAEIQFIKAQEAPRWLKYGLAENFIYELPYADYIQRFDLMRSFEEQDMQQFFQKHLKNNRATVYKEQGEKADLPRMTKPSIKPVELNRDKHSAFYDSIAGLPRVAMKPVFVDLKEEVQKTSVAEGVDLYTTPNERNDLFYITYRYQSGKAQDPWIAAAVEFLDLCGTEQYSATEFKQEMYKLGAQYGVYTGNDKIYVYLSGLEKNLEPSLKLFESLLQKPVGDSARFSAFVDDMAKERQNKKKSKYEIMQGLLSYAMYGPKNPFNSLVSLDSLRAAGHQSLTTLVGELPQKYEQKITFYGSTKPAEMVEILKKNHPIGKNLSNKPLNEVFPKRKTTGGKIYLANYDMVQAYIYLMGASSPMQVDLEAPAIMFNQYFSGSMASEVFANIREKRALAYSASARYQTAEYKQELCFQTAFIGTQRDKLVEAVAAMKELLRESKVDEAKFEEMKKSWQAKQAAKRIYGRRSLSLFMDAEYWGIKGNPRELRYQAIEGMEAKDLDQFKAEQVAGLNYDLCLLGKTKDLPYKKIKGYDKVETLDLETLFGY